MSEVVYHMRNDIFILLNALITEKTRADDNERKLIQKERLVDYVMIERDQWKERAKTAEAKVVAHKRNSCVGCRYEKYDVGLEPCCWCIKYSKYVTLENEDG